MKLSVFRSYPLSQRARMVTACGQVLLLRHYMSYAIYLYRLDGFFAEVWLSTADCRVVMVHGFKDTGMLLPFPERKV